MKKKGFQIAVWAYVVCSFLGIILPAPLEIPYGAQLWMIAALAIGFGDIPMEFGWCLLIYMIAALILLLVLGIRALRRKRYGMLGCFVAHDAVLMLVYMISRNVDRAEFYLGPILNVIFCIVLFSAAIRDTHFSYLNQK